MNIEEKIQLIENGTLEVIDKEELKWLLKGYEMRTVSKFKSITKKNYF